MKKRILVVSLIFLTIVISILASSYNTNTRKTFIQDGVTYALTLDGESVNTIPQKGMYQVDVECENATGKWLYDEWKLRLTNMSTDKVTCNLAFTTITKTNLNNYIIGLSGTTQGTGEVVNENGYRYEGKNPNNYIWFNNELWRIIGVFDEASHGVSGQNLVKIISTNSIGGLVWDNEIEDLGLDENSFGKNDWSNSDLKNLLNGAYLNSENGTGGEYCYGYEYVPANCDYSGTGVNDTYRPMIENVTWYLGGHSSPSATAEAFYGYERGTTVYSGRPTSTEGYIGLMYPSDYGYSVLASSCARTTSLGSYGNASCAGQSWLYGEGMEWTITPNSSDPANVFFVSSDGTLTNYYANYGWAAVRPVLYLDSSVYVMDGNGSVSDPYIIGM